MLCAFLQRMSILREGSSREINKETLHPRPCGQDADSLKSKIDVVFELQEMERKQVQSSR